MSPFVLAIVLLVAGGVGFSFLDHLHRKRAAWRADAHARRIMRDLHGWTPPARQEEKTKGK